MGEMFEQNVPTLVPGIGAVLLQGQLTLIVTFWLEGGGH